MTAGIIVAIMITPIITSITREVFATTPAVQKEATYGLGATRWEMIRGAVFPHSRGGVVAAVMIGFGRAIGETIAVALLDRRSQQLSAHLFGPGDTLASIIANQFGEATRHPAGRAHRDGCRAVRAHDRRRHPRPRHRGALDRALGVRHDRGDRRPLPLDDAGPQVRARAGAQTCIATGAHLLVFLVALVPLVFVIVYVVQRGSEVFCWDFLTEADPVLRPVAGGGMGPAVVGTLVITGAAALMAIPLGVLGGIYLNEYGGKKPLARLMRFLSEVMTGVPSIVMGLFIYTFVVLRHRGAQRRSPARWRWRA